MDEIIIEILNQYYLTKNDLESIKIFIQKCSISDFEKLKDLDWEESQKKVK